MISTVAQLFQPQLTDIPIQPVDEQGQPATLCEIAGRIRALGYRCEKCGALVGGRVEAEPSSQGVRVHPFALTYRLMVPCLWCGHSQPLSDMIRAHQGGDHR